MNEVQRGLLVVADISGYTRYLSGVELDHSHDIARWCWSASGQHSGIGGELRYSEIVTYREGHAILIEHFRDHAQALKAVGLEE